MSSTAFDWIQENLSYNAASTEASVAKKAIMAEKKKQQRRMTAENNREKKKATHSSLSLSYILLFILANAPIKIS